MNRDYAHLAPSAAAMLDCSNADRLQAIHEERWITYPRARLALEFLESLLARPRTTRMISTAIYADSGMCKTMLMERFKRAHPPAYNVGERRMVAPVLALQMASHATERRFYGQLLMSIGVPFTPRATVMDLEVQVLRNLRRMEVKVLMLDEVHNILAGNAREQRIVLNTLRYLSNELNISLVCLGIAEAREAIGGDVQLARRFEELLLPRWQGDEDFQEFVLAVLRNLPLRASSQIAARALRHVLQVTDGVTAGVFRLFNDLAADAIVSGAETITDDNITAWRPMGRATPAFV